MRRLFGALCCVLLSQASFAATQGLKIVHVASYGVDWAWVQDQQRGFLEGLGSSDVTVRTIALDAKRNTPAQIKALAAQTIESIDALKPDLIYLTDDVAQAEIGQHYAGSSIPIVYSGVNKEHADYGYDKVGNVTGVLEREHFLGTLSLLREIKGKQKPGAKFRIAIVLDDDPTWQGVSGRIRTDLAKTPDVEVVQWLQPKTFEEFQTAIRALQGKVDAIGTLGIFRFTGSDGKFVDYEAVQHWMVDNSKVPDFSFWDTRVERGTLCAMTVDGVAQGRAAGRMARRILVDKQSPASIAPEATARGRPMISLARARKLGIQIQSSVLLNAQVLTHYAWE